MGQYFSELKRPGESDSFGIGSGNFVSGFPVEWLLCVMRFENQGHRFGEPLKGFKAEVTKSDLCF